MNKFNTLLRLELKANSMLAYIRGALKGGDKAARRMLWAYFAVLIVAVMFLFTYIFLADAVMGAAVALGNGMPGVIMSLVFMVYCVVSVIFGTFPFCPSSLWLRTMNFWPPCPYLRARFSA